MNHTSTSSSGWLSESRKRFSRLLRRSADLLDPPPTAQPIVIDVGAALVAAEHEVYQAIGSELAASNPGRDAGKCDRIFGQHYSYGFLKRCNAIGLSSRAAIAGDAIIKSVIDQEKKSGTEFHKGALFHDTGAAHFLSGNIDKYEYLLAMAAEENVRTSGGSRDHLNLQKDALTGQTITERLECACDLLNGAIAGHGAHYTFLTGRPQITATQLDAWRHQLHPLEQFEFLRIIHDIHQFLGIDYSEYEPVKDNPFVLLRLAKTLSHLAQWTESIFTRWQGGGGGSLSPKLTQDPDFGATLSTAAGSQQLFAGNCPHGVAVDTELNQLLTDLLASPSGDQRQWRLLRIFYIARNATAHTIDSTLNLYNRRDVLLNLLQTVFVSVLVICQLKGKTMP